MPLEDLLPKSAIDELYEKYKGSTIDYNTLRIELEQINTSLANRDANTYYESSDLTYAAANRKDKQYASIPKRIVKDRFYGIVLYKTGDFNKEVYIDVPGKTSPLPDPDVFYTEPELDLAKYKEYLFEPSSLDYYSTPVIGGIAVVKVPKNFPSHINTNAEDAIYLHMKRPDILVAINDSGETGRPPLGGGSGGGLGAVSSPITPVGGTAEMTPGGDTTGDTSTGTETTEPLDVLLLGDSHVYGPYGKKLKDLFKNGGHNVTFVGWVGANAGHYLNGSYKSLSQGHEGDYDTEAKGKTFDLAIVTLGTNDAAGTNSDETAGAAANKIMKLTKAFTSEKTFWVGPPSFHESIAKSYGGIAEYARDDLNKKAARLWNAGSKIFGSSAIDPRTITRLHVNSKDIHFDNVGGEAWAKFVYGITAPKVVPKPAAPVAPSTDGAAPVAGAPSVPGSGIAPLSGRYNKTDKFAAPDGKIAGVPLSPDKRIKGPQKVLGYWDSKPGVIVVRQLPDKYSLGCLEGSQCLQIPAADKLEQMFAEYERYVETTMPDSIKKQAKTPYMLKPRVNSSFRSWVVQDKLYKKWVRREKGANPADPPGTSKHQYGLAIDITGTGIKNSTAFKGTGPFYEWLTQNAPRYGFKRTASREHWHWEFRYGWLDSKPGDFMSATRPLNP